jgi:hypothetical protein
VRRGADDHDALETLPAVALAGCFPGGSIDGDDLRGAAAGVPGAVAGASVEALGPDLAGACAYTDPATGHVDCYPVRVTQGSSTCVYLYHLSCTVGSPGIERDQTQLACANA